MHEPTQNTAQRHSPLRISLATYNIHQCIGVDGRRDPRRVLRVIRELRADVIGLQEVYSEKGHTPDLAQLDYLAHGAGLTPLAGPTMLRGRGHYGNGLLSAFPVMESRLLDITVPGREPRGTIDAILRVNDHSVRVVVTHLGLRAGERRTQVQRILHMLAGSNDLPLILLADVNEWSPFAFPLRMFRRYVGRSKAAPSFPSRFPVLPLDRIWVGRGVRLEGIRVHKTPLSRKASDHLPVRAQVLLEEVAERGRQK